jgi:hypothetical protein
VRPGGAETKKQRNETLAIHTLGCAEVRSKEKVETGLIDGVGGLQAEPLEVKQEGSLVD